MTAELVQRLAQLKLLLCTKPLNTTRGRSNLKLSSSGGKDSSHHDSSGSSSNRSNSGVNHNGARGNFSSNGTRVNPNSNRGTQINHNSIKKPRGTMYATRLIHA